MMALGHDLNDRPRAVPPPWSYGDARAYAHPTGARKA
jgi:hypothetical protein